jgi:hypothetical protein
MPSPPDAIDALAMLNTTLGVVIMRRLDALGCLEAEDREAARESLGILLDTCALCSQDELRDALLDLAGELDRLLP